MTTRPRLVELDGSRLLPGLAAVALFVVLGATFLTAQFGSPQGFAPGSITATIGFAMFDLTDLATHPVEGFLLAFLLIAVVLDAALDGSVMLAKREEGSETPLGTSEDADATGEEPVATDGGEARQ